MLVDQKQVRGKYNGISEVAGLLLVEIVRNATRKALEENWNIEFFKDAIREDISSVIDWSVTEIGVSEEEKKQYYKSGNATVEICIAIGAVFFESHKNKETLELPSKLIAEIEQYSGEKAQSEATEVDITEPTEAELTGQVPDLEGGL